MAGSPPNFHKMDPRSACIQGVVKVKGHVIRALSWILGMSYSVIDGLVIDLSSVTSDVVDQCMRRAPVRSSGGRSVTQHVHGRHSSVSVLVEIPDSSTNFPGISHGCINILLNHGTKSRPTQTGLCVLNAIARSYVSVTSREGFCSSSSMGGILPRGDFVQGIFRDLRGCESAVCVRIES